MTEPATPVPASAPALDPVAQLSRPVPLWLVLLLGTLVGVPGGAAATNLLGLGGGSVGASDLAAVKADVGTLKGDVATLKGDTATIKGQVGYLVGFYLQRGLAAPGGVVVGSSTLTSSAPVAAPVAP